VWKKAVCRADEDKNVVGSERSKYGSFCRVKGTHSNVMGRTGLASWTPSDCSEEEESKVQVAALSIGGHGDFPPAARCHHCTALRA